MIAARYRIEIKDSAAKSLKGLPSEQQRRIRLKINLLAENPYSPSTRKLKGEESVYRLRVGDYRVVYEVLEQTITVLVLRIGHRKDIYR